MLGIRSTRRSRARASRYRALAGALDAGLALDRALQLTTPPSGVTSAVAHPELTSSLPRSSQSVAARIGGPEAGPTEIAAITAADRAGEISQTLRHLADDLDAQSQAQNHLWSANAYPLLVLHLVVPAMSTSLLITDPTRFVLRVVVATGTLWAVIALLAVSMSWLLRKRGARERLARLPVVGVPLAAAARTRFLRTLGLLYGSGVHAVEAMAAAHAALGPAAASVDYDALLDRVRRGEPLPQAFAALTSFDPLDRAELVTGAEAGELEVALRRVAARAELEWHASTSRLARIAGALVYGIAVVSVAFAVIRFYTGYFEQLGLR